MLILQRKRCVARLHGCGLESWIAHVARSAFAPRIDSPWLIVTGATNGLLRHTRLDALVRGCVGALRSLVGAAHATLVEQLGACLSDEAGAPPLSVGFASYSFACCALSQLELRDGSFCAPSEQRGAWDWEHGGRHGGLFRDDGRLSLSPDGKHGTPGA